MFKWKLCNPTMKVVRSLKEKLLIQKYEFTMKLWMSRIWFSVFSKLNTYIPAKWVECSPMVRKTRVQSQVESYQRLKKWYLIPPCLALSTIRQGSRVKWSNNAQTMQSHQRRRWYSLLLNLLHNTYDLIILSKLVTTLGRFEFRKRSEVRWS